MTDASTLATRLQDSLRKDRQEVADKLYAEYDFGDSVVEAANGWEHRTNGVDLVRVVFLAGDKKDDDGYTESEKVWFNVCFSGPKSSVASDAYCITQSGNILGNARVSMDTATPIAN